MDSIFKGAQAFDQDLDNWNVPSDCSTKRAFDKAAKYGEGKRPYPKWYKGK